MLELPTKEDIESTIEGQERLLEEAKADADLAREMLASIENRVLVEEPELTPRQLHERLMNNGAVRG